jgi:Zn-dependent membrane protease YugP
MTPIGDCLPFLIALIALATLALLFGPQIWVRLTMARHAVERPDFPGTGGELAEHLLTEAGVTGVRVEEADEGDHYDPDEKVVRLSRTNYHGRSVTAAAVAAHEVGHAIQDAQGYRPLAIRQRLARIGIHVERIGAVVMMTAPIMFAVTRAPLAMAVQIGGAIVILGFTIAVHLATLPTEFDASYRRALPTLEKYLKPEDMPAARRVLRAAAFTYVAAALASLLDVMRWLRLMRF